MIERRQPRRSLRRGFTLIEAMSTIVVVAILGTAGSGIILDAADQYLEATTRSQLHRELSIGMDRIMRELRAIPLDSSASGIAPNIDWTTSTSVLFNTTYYVAESGANNEVWLWDGTGEIVLLKDVTDVTFKYFNESNAEIGPALSAAGCDPIRRIEISITLTRNGVSETLRGRMFLRSTVSGAGV